MIHCSFNELIHVDKIKMLDQQINTLTVVSGYSIEDLTDLFKKGYTLQPPKEPEPLASMSYNVITLCGSTRFKEEFMREQKRLTLEGNIVISVGLFGHSGDKEAWDGETKLMLDDMHKRKIDMADEIFVINPDGYIGSSTRSEINYAESKGKKITYMCPDDCILFK